MTFKILFVLFFLFVLVSSASASVVINEVMYNPQGGDNNKEYVEIYFDQWANLTNFIIADNSSNDTIEVLQYSTSLYALIVEEGFNYTGINASVYSAGATIGNNLNNDQDIIYLYFPNNSLIDSIYYDDSMGADNDGNSLQLCNQEWLSMPPTPGAPNNCSQQQEKRIELSYLSQVQCNENFTIALDASNFDDGIYDVKIDIKDIVTDNRVAKVWNGTKWISTTYYVNSILIVNGGVGGVELTFKIEDFLGEVYLKPAIRNMEAFEGDYSLSVQCDSNQSDQEESEIKITDAPSKAQFGETVEVELDIYKGDTSKYAVYVYVEDEDGNKVSDKITLHFKTKFTSQTVEVELSLKCRNETGSYDIVAEGLGTEDKEEIELDACGTNGNGSNDADDTITIGDFSYGLTIPNSINLDEEFRVKLKITSEANQEQNFLVWSYVYRGNKCYSCSGGGARESNAKSVVVQPNSFVEVELQNSVNVDDAEPGLYKLKIKVLQEGLKTPKEFTYDLKIEEGKKASSESLSQKEQSNIQSDNQQQSGQQPDYITGSAVMESKSFLVNKTLSYVLATLCMLLVIYIIIKKI